MKPYTVKLRATITTTVLVVARTQAEAENKADRLAEDGEFGSDWETSDVEVMGVEPTPDL